MPVINARGSRVERTLRHDILRFWRPLFPSVIRELIVDGPAFAVPAWNNDPATDRDPAVVTRAPAPGDTTLSWIDALAGTNTAGTWLILTSRHPTETLTVEVPTEFMGASVDRLLPSADHKRFELREAAERCDRQIALPPWSHARLRKEGSPE
jgi:hypothetical protein